MVTTTLYITAHYAQYPRESTDVPFYLSVIRHATVPAPYQTSDTQPFDHHEQGSNRTVALNRAPTMDY